MTVCFQAGKYNIILTKQYVRQIILQSDEQSTLSLEESQY